MSGSEESVRALPGLKKRMYIDFNCEFDTEALNKAFAGKALFSTDGPGRAMAEYEPTQLPTVELIKGVVGEHRITDLTVTEPSIEEVVMKIYKDGVPK